MDERSRKIAANVLRRVVRTSGMSIMELARQGRVGYDSLLAAMKTVTHKGCHSYLHDFWCPAS